MPNALRISSATTDGQVYSDNAAYATARTGGTLAVDTADTNDGVGQSTEFRCRELFLGFDTTLPVGATVTSAKLFMWLLTDNSLTDFTVEARVFDWGTTLTTADWISGANLGNYPLVASKSTAGLTAGQYVEFTSQAGFAAAINIGGYTRLVLNSDRHRAGNQPTQNEWVVFYLGDAATAMNRPYLYIEYTLRGIDYTKRVYWGSKTVERSTVSPGYYRIEAEEGVRSFERGRVAEMVLDNAMALAVNSYAAYTVDVPNDGIMVTAGTYTIEIPWMVVGTDEYVGLQALIVHDGATVTGSTIMIASQPGSGLALEAIRLPVVMPASRLCTSLQFRIKVASLSGTGVQIQVIGIDDVRIGVETLQAATVGWPRRAPVMSFVSPPASSHASPTLVAGNPTLELITDFLYPTDTITVTRYLDSDRQNDHYAYTPGAVQINAKKVFDFTKGVAPREHDRRTLRLPIWGPVVADWLDSHAYVYGDVVQPTTPNGHAYKCVQSGTSGANEPTWPTDGTMVVDQFSENVWWQDIGVMTPLAPPAACRDLAAGTAAWQPNHVYAMGSKVIPTNPSDDHYYRTVTGGTSGANEPTWPTARGSVVDNNITWIDYGERYVYGVNTYYELTVSDGTNTIGTIGLETLLDVQNPKLVTGAVDPPTLVAEPDTTSDTEVTLQVTAPVSWDAADGPLMYLYRIVGPDGTATYINNNNLHLHRLPAGTYTWSAASIDPWGRVSAYQTDDVFVVSQVGYPTTCVLDPLPAVIYEQPRTVWSTVDLDGVPQDAYELEIATDAGFTSFVFQSGVVVSTDMSYQHSGLTNGLRYRRLRTRTGGADWSTWQSDSFTLASKTSQSEDFILYRRHPDGTLSQLNAGIVSVQVRQRLDGAGEFSFQVNQFDLIAMNNLFGLFEFEEVSGGVIHDVWGGNDMNIGV